MRRRLLGVLAGALLGVLALAYLAATVYGTGLAGAPVAIPLASVLLVAGWAWFLVVARTQRHPWARLGLHLAAVGVCVVLVLLANISETHESVLAPALVLTFPLTLLYLGAHYLRRLFLVILLIVAGLVGAGYAYFGIVLILLGLLALPRRVGPYLRELFPRRVRQEEA